MDKHAALVAVIKNWSPEDILNAWNEYCSEKCMDNYIYDNVYVSELFEGAENPVDEALRAAYYGDYRYSDEYVKLNAYGNLESFGRFEIEEHVDYGELADYLEDAGDAMVAEVDPDELSEHFTEQIQELFPYMRGGCVESLMCEIMESSEPYDLLMEDWNDLAEDFKDRYDSTEVAPEE